MTVVQFITLGRTNYYFLLLVQLVRLDCHTTSGLNEHKQHAAMHQKQNKTVYNFLFIFHCIATPDTLFLLIH